VHDPQSHTMEAKNNHAKNNHEWCYQNMLPCTRDCRMLDC